MLFTHPNNQQICELIIILYHAQIHINLRSEWYNNHYLLVVHCSKNIQISPATHFLFSSHTTTCHCLVLKHVFQLVTYWYCLPGKNHFFCY